MTFACGTGKEKSGEVKQVESLQVSFPASNSGTKWLPDTGYRMLAELVEARGSDN
jgi:hypothetical protein